MTTTERDSDLEPAEDSSTRKDTADPGPVEASPTEPAEPSAPPEQTGTPDSPPPPAGAAPEAKRDQAPGAEAPPAERLEAEARGEQSETPETPPSESGKPSPAPPEGAAPARPKKTSRARQTRIAAIQTPGPMSTSFCQQRDLGRPQKLELPHQAVAAKTPAAAARSLA